MEKKLLSIVFILAMIFEMFPENIVFAKEVTVEDATDELLLYADANHQEDGTIELTPLQTWCSGSAWCNYQIDATKGFSVEFNYWAGGGRDDYYKGADGIVVTFSEKTGIGDAGNYLGFVGDMSYGVELDSYPENTNDPEGKHVGIIQGVTSNHLNYVLDDRVDDSKWHNLKVDYNENVITVYLDGEAVLTQDSIALPDNVYIGISAATGSGYNRHMIKEFYITGEESDNISTRLVIDDFRVSPAKKTIRKGRSFPIKVTMVDDSAWSDLTMEEWDEFFEENVDGIEFRSTRSSIASVNRKTGKVIGKKKGSAVIRTTIYLANGESAVYKTKVYVKK